MPTSAHRHPVAAGPEVHPGIGPKQNITISAQPINELGVAEPVIQQQGSIASWSSQARRTWPRP